MTVTDAPATPLVGLAAELQRQLATKRDLMADTRRVSLVSNHDHPTDILRAQIDLPDGVEELGVTRHAHGQIGTHLGIPWKLYERLLDNHPDLIADLANGLLSREPASRMLRTLDGNVRAFLSDRYRPRDNWELMEEVVLPQLRDYPGEVQFKRCDLTETRMYVKVVLPGIQREVRKVGDIVRGGIIIQNSEVGAGALAIFPYTEVLACLNGMVHTDFGQRSRHVGKRIESTEEAWELYSDATLQLDDAAFFSKCRDTLRATLDETVFDRIVEQMRELADIKLLGDPVKQVEVLANRHGFNDGERGSILSALVEGADLSAWGYVNAITQTARDTDNADRQVELEALAGRMTSDASWAREAVAV